MVKSFIEYWTEVKRYISRKDDEILFFRGQANGTHKKMIPGIFRSDSIDEQSEYKQIQIDYPEEFDKNSHLSNLVKMQHYGCNTRLLDFSLNPLVALYFAVETDEKENGKVFVVKVKKEDILFQNSDRALMLSCLPAFSKKDKDAIREFCTNHPKRITERDIQSSDVMRRFLHEIRGEYPAFETEIVGADLLKYYFIRPYKDNLRMKTQDGAFAIFGLDEKKAIEEINKKTDIIEINHLAKKEILKDLDAMRINSSTIYPGLERKAMLNREKNVRWENI